MRVKRGYTTRWKMGIWGAIFGTTYLEFYHPEYKRYWYNHWTDNFYLFLDYDAFKRREQWRWNKYLTKWDPYDGFSQGMETMGNLSSTVIDKLFFGPKRWQDPPSYDREANEFIKLAESSGLDPAKPLLDSITKVVNAYYPIDLDDNPDETKVVLQPKIQWTHGNNIDEIVEEDEKKPKPNSLARYLWSIPGYKEYYENLRNDARAEEEELVTSMDNEQRRVWYERTDELIKRWALELNDYAPLLAYRWDRKLKLANYLMSLETKDQQKEVVDILMEPGGVKQVFIRAGVITPDHNDYQTH